MLKPEPSGDPKRHLRPGPALREKQNRLKVRPLDDIARRPETRLKLFIRPINHSPRHDRLRTMTAEPTRFDFHENP